MPLQSEPFDSRVSLTQVGQDFIIDEAFSECGAFPKLDLLPQLDLARWISSLAATGGKFVEAVWKIRNKTMSSGGFQMVNAERCKSMMLKCCFNRIPTIAALFHP
jgi:hypothetical protein